MTNNYVKYIKLVAIYFLIFSFISLMFYFGANYVNKVIDNYLFLLFVGIFFLIIQIIISYFIGVTGYGAIKSIIAQLLAYSTAAFFASMLLFFLVGEGGAIEKQSLVSLVSLGFVSFKNNIHLRIPPDILAFYFGLLHSQKIMQSQNGMRTERNKRQK